MAVFFTESFDGHGTTISHYLGKWTSVATGSIASTTGPVTGNYLQTNASSGTRTWVKGFPTTFQKDTIVVGMHVRFNTLNTSPIFALQSDSAGTTHVHIRSTAIGELIIARGGNITSGGGTTIATSSTVLQEDLWHYIEAKVKLGDAGVGTYDIRVDGASVLSGTDDTKNAGTKTVFDAFALNLDHSSGNSDRNFDNIYILETTIGTNTNFLGTVFIEALKPNANGNSSQFVGSDTNSNDNYLLVDELAQDDETTWVESSTDDNKDTYNFEPTTGEGAVKMVAQYTRARRTSTGTKGIAMVARHASSETTGSDQVLSTDYGWYQELYETNPSTSTQWTLADVDAAEFGYKARP